jgi:fumarate hydratase class II
MATDYPHTQLAVKNFPISQLRFPRSFLRALGLIKAAAAKVNGEMGALPPEMAAVEAAANEVAEGKHDSQFVVDIFQTGSGTSTNMNANEVIGKLAGAHPNDHVNRGQSSNDVIPSAIHIAAAETAHGLLFPSMDRLRRSLEAKSRRVPRNRQDRTYLQDAVPMRLGQEFGGYAMQVQAS